MCGIVGIVESDLSRPVPLRRARSAWCDARPPRAGRRGQHRARRRRRSAMRRLSIVDLAGGQQPFSNETGTSSSSPTARSTTSRRCARARAARAHVPQRARTSKSWSTRYEQWGADLSDAAARHVRARAVGRPRAGRCSRRAIAPARSRSTGRRRRAGCCSPRKSRRCSSGPRCARELDLEALDQFLTYEYVVAPRTILKGVHKLPAGHYLRLPRRRGRRCTATGTRRRSACGAWRDDEAAEALRDGAAAGGRQPDDGRRAARRVPVRRHRLEHARRAS